MATDYVTVASVRLQIKDGHPTCDHLRTEIRYVWRGNAKHFVRQCMTCGIEVAGIKKGGSEMRHMAEVLAKDESLHNAWQQAITEYWDNYHAGQQRERQEDYDDYVSPYNEEWQYKRQLVFRRDKHVCQICGGYGNTVHHLTYDHFKNEFLFELVCLCQPCHEQYYKKTVVR